MCAETDECLFWTFLQKRKRKICKLKAGVLNTGWRRKKDNAVSGTMLNGCNPLKDEESAITERYI